MLQDSTMKQGGSSYIRVAGETRVTWEDLVEDHAKRVLERPQARSLEEAGGRLRM